MARIHDPSDAEIAAWREWVETRPDVVRAIAERLDPWTLYRMRSTGQRVTMYSISEDGTVTVDISGRHNAILFERQVFGVDPSDLEPCDLPAPGEPVGAMMSGDQVDEHIDALRVMVRPDLFMMGADGKAQRKVRTRRDVRRGTK